MNAGVVSGLVKTMKHNDFDATVQEAACGLVAQLVKCARTSLKDCWGMFACIDVVWGCALCGCGRVLHSGQP